MKRRTKKTIAFDFDWVIHSYDNWWQWWVIYGDIDLKIIEFIKDIMHYWYSVYIHSTRNPYKIKKRLQDKLWIDEEDYNYTYKTKYPFWIEVIPFWKRFRNKNNIVWISRRKIPAIIYIDDRWYRFEWTEKMILDFYTLYPKNAK